MFCVQKGLKFMNKILFLLKRDRWTTSFISHSMSAKNGLEIKIRRELVSPGRFWMDCLMRHKGLLEYTYQKPKDQERHTGDRHSTIKLTWCAKGIWNSRYSVQIEGDYREIGSQLWWLSRVGHSKRPTLISESRLHLVLSNYPCIWHDPSDSDLDEPLQFRSLSRASSTS